MGDVSHIRVDLQEKKFIFVKLQHKESLNLEKDIKNLVKSKQTVIMKVLTDYKHCVLFYFYETKDFPLYYQDSELVDLSVLKGHLKVVLLSVVKIDNQERIKVNISPKSHFILPEDHTQITIDNFEYWSKRRLMVEVETRDMIYYNWKDDYRFYFYGEECDSDISKTMVTVRTEKPKIEAAQ